MTVFSGFGALIGPAKILLTQDMFKDKTLAIDISCWFHQLFSKNRSEVEFVNAISWRAEKLDGMEVKAIYVFDGKPNPDKKLEDDRRAAERQKKTNSNMAIPWDFRMAAFKALHEKGHDAIFARHEADHQCAHLVRTGKADAVMSVDFDHLTLGVSMITKVKWSKHGVVSAQLFSLENFKKWTPDRVFPCMAINWFLELIARLGADAFMIASLLLKCDYIKKIDGFGNAKLKSLAPHLEGGTPRHIMDAFRKWLESGDRSAQRFANHINDKLEKDLTFAYNAFMYPPVFDVEERHLRRLNECPDDVDEAALVPLDDGDWLRTHGAMFIRGRSRGGDACLEDGDLRPLLEYYLSKPEEINGNLGFMGPAALGVWGGVAG